MKLVEILSYNSVKNEYEHYTIVTSKHEKSLVTTDNNPTDKFYNFIIENTDVGPFGRVATSDELENGDVIQLGRNDDGFYHTLLVVGFDGEDILVAAQTDNAYARPLSTYTYDFARYIKILGVRLESPDTTDNCFERVMAG
jgi:hypothetical protein